MKTMHRKSFYWTLNPDDTARILNLAAPRRWILNLPGASPSISHALWRQSSSACQMERMVWSESSVLGEKGNVKPIQVASNISQETFKDYTETKW